MIDNFGNVIRAVSKAHPEIKTHLSGRARWIASSQPWTEHKTYDHYLRQIKSNVTKLFNDDISKDSFVDTMADIIPQQLTKAWYEGMRANGLDPEYDMLDEWQLILDERILSEFDFVDRFSDDIVAARKSSTLEAMLSRAELWANRYTDLVNEAKLITAEGTTKYKWILGATEDHCRQCLALNGIVAFAREWEQSRFRTQNPPNEMLDCGGWRCTCGLEETTDRRTWGALNRLLNIAQGVFIGGEY